MKTFKTFVKPHFYNVSLVLLETSFLRISTLTSITNVRTQEAQKSETLILVLYIL